MTGVNFFLCVCSLSAVGPAVSPPENPFAATVLCRNPFGPCQEEKTRTELRVYKGQARSGRFKSLLLKLWGLLRAVGFLGFLLFVYLAVSQDAFRSRGVDVYRLAH